MKEQNKYLTSDKKVINFHLNPEFLKKQGEPKLLKAVPAEVIYLKEWRRDR